MFGRIYCAVNSCYYGTDDESKVPIHLTTYSTYNARVNGSDNGIVRVKQCAGLSESVITRDYWIMYVR